jgi:hypothetical protein
MNAEELKRLEEIKAERRAYGFPGYESELIARLEAEVAENERLRDEVTRTKNNALDMQRFQQGKVEAAEATCQSLLEQSSRWEAQALEAGVRIAELEALFALQQTRMAEATHMWQEATGKQDVLPDLGDLLAWLMARPAALEALVRELRDALTCADRDLAETAVTTGYRMRDDTAQKMTDAFARADKALAEKPQEGKP